ncbi:MAG: hypothetical protein IPM82_32295 [Saprospiraceae bacterium]|nr:hypothetical protein [Saprospiraceae bacterium]
MVTSSAVWPRKLYRLYFNGHEALLISKGFGQLEEFLPIAHFVLVHNDAIVNLGHIRKGAERRRRQSGTVQWHERIPCRPSKKDLMGRLQVF